MTSSELSNALNPNVIQIRPRRRQQYSTVSYVESPHHPVLVQPQPYIPHRSELELAIAEPPPPLPPPPAPRTQASLQSVNAVRELLHFLSATKESTELERKRRLEWEREQEERYTQQEERYIQQEERDLVSESLYQHAPAPDYPAPLLPQTMITLLCQLDFGHGPGGIGSAHRDSSAGRGAASVAYLAHFSGVGIPCCSSPCICPRLVDTTVQDGTVVRAASSQCRSAACVVEEPPAQPLPDAQESSPDPSESNQRGVSLQPEAPAVEAAPLFAPPTPQSTGPASTPAASTPNTNSNPNPRKRPTPVPPSDTEDGSSDDESSGSSAGGRPKKRANGHDGRCLTIQTAMRTHIYRMMKIRTGQDLPDSHWEGDVLSANEPVRFVWDKTPKQSPHNATMRARIVADIKARRRLYKHVPEKDFSRKTLESTFDQAFTTLRQKFKAQRDTHAAVHLKRREDNKALRSRHLQRRKTKLARRAEVRKGMDMYAHSTFDGALQPECMSSEESGEDLRLQRFLAILDEEERVELITKPKRGTVRKERCIGPPKDALCMPPKGVAGWMISQRWMRELQHSRPDKLAKLKDIVVETPDFDWENLRVSDSVIWLLKDKTSVNLLDSLENFLSTFQKDLSAVSGQISNLQDRSKDIENRLKSRKKIEKPLSNLLADLCIPPPLASLILDTNVDESWIPAISDFENRLDTLKVRVRVKAARDLAEVAEGLRIVAATKLRTFFLSLFQPIRSSMTTNMQVIQTSILLKYRALYAFLQRHAAGVAHEIQRAYVGAARTYFETGFRRYLRSLGWIKARTVETANTIVAGAERTLEALFRAALLVLMDNATAEYTFVTTFFAAEPRPSMHTKQSSGSVRSSVLLSPTNVDFDDARSTPGSDFGGVSPRQRVTSIHSVMDSEHSAKEEMAAMNATWKQIMDPVLEYCQTFVQSMLEPPPPIIPLLTMIRLTEDVMAEVQKRDCGPLETFIFGIRLQMWPLFQKSMAEHIDSLKKFAEGATSGTSAEELRRLMLRCPALLRLRQELSKLITTHTDKIGDAVAKASAQSSLYETLLQGLSTGPRPTSHPKAQSELAYWREREEEARRRIVSTHGRR
ncbi:Vacuolar protein sorting-associated protein 52 A [Grifola frondosa]|uniref:Vacuolar protein sorting-associated protein 52 A n=1 Tax=Grifola frondosa TaxID=5627 RepID=A0A1C7M4S0_GRIFR|nr:Vacuolar protein sorting-associated protein 52 A [Grifola frondosa]